MARLTWQNLDAPHLSTRDLAIAGGQITGAFDRLGQTLLAREQALREQATNDASVNVLLANDQGALDQIAAGGLAGLDKRVNRAEVAKLLSAQRDALLAREGQQQTNTLNQEKILDAQGANALAPLALQLHELQYAGKTDEYEAMISELAAQDPLVARGVRQLSDDLWTARTTGVDDRRQQLSDDRTDARAREGLSLQRRELDLRTREREALEAGSMFGYEGAQRLAGMDPKEARQALIKDPAFARMPPRAQGAALQMFDLSQEAWATPNEEERAGKPGAKDSFNRFGAELAQRRAGVESARAEAEAAFWSGKPGFAALRRAASDKGYADKTFDDVLKAVDDNMGPLAFGHSADVRKVLGAVPGQGDQPALPELSPGEFLAGLDQFGGAGWLERNLDPRGGRATLEKLATEIKRAKASGGLPQIEAEAGQALGRHDRYLRALDRLQRKAGGYASTRGGEFDPNFRQLLEEEERRYRSKPSK